LGKCNIINVFQLYVREIVESDVTVRQSAAMVCAEFKGSGGMPNPHNLKKLKLTEEIT